jgi:hypothetical protein
MSTTVLGESFNPSARKANLTDAVGHPSRTLAQYAVSGDTPKAPATSGRTSCSIVTSLKLRLLLSSSIVILVGRSCTLTITHLSSASTFPPPRAFAIFSLHCSKSSVVVPALGVNAIPVRTEETVSTSFPLGKALFTVLMMNSGCTDRRAESSGSLTKTLFVLESFLLGRGWAGLFGRFAGVVPLSRSA